MARNQLLCVAMFMAFFFSNTPATSSTKPVPNPTKSHQIVTKFCNTKSTNEDKEFCTKVLESHPNSTSAKDNPSLLLMAIDLGIKNLTTTKDYMTKMSKNKATNPTLALVLKECIPLYGTTITELRIIPADMADDPALASYDAFMAREAIISCDKSFKTSKISDGSVMSRHKIAKAYVQLCVDISNTIH